MKRFALRRSEEDDRRIASSLDLEHIYQTVVIPKGMLHFADLQIYLHCNASLTNAIRYFAKI